MIHIKKKSHRLIQVLFQVNLTRMYSARDIKNQNNSVDLDTTPLSKKEWQQIFTLK